MGGLLFIGRSLSADPGSVLFLFCPINHSVPQEPGTAVKLLIIFLMFDRIVPFTGDDNFLPFFRSNSIFHRSDQLPQMLPLSFYRYLPQMWKGLL